MLAGGGGAGCRSSCSPDAALRDVLLDQQETIDTMQEEVTRMRDLVRSMMSGTSSGCSQHYSRYDTTRDAILRALESRHESAKSNKKLSYRRGTARCVVSLEILPVATQQ